MPQLWPGIAAHLPDEQIEVQQSEALAQAAPTSRHCCEEQDPALQWFEQQSVFTVQPLPGPLQNTGAAQWPLVQTPEQQTPPWVAEQVLPAGMQMLPGPPSPLPPSPFPLGGWQLQPPMENPAKKAATNAMKVRRFMGSLLDVDHQRRICLFLPALPATPS